MTLISDFNYRQYCKDFIVDVLARPKMYFQTIDELESIMRGHQVAFDQIGAIGDGKTFHGCFSDWVFNKYQVSCSSGWAYAIKVISCDQGVEPIDLFSDYIDIFFSEWIQA